MKSTHVLCAALTIFFVSVFQCDISLAQEPARTQTRRDTIESYDSATRLMTISVELSLQGRLSSHMAFDIPRGLIGEPSFNWEGAGTCRRRNTQFTCSGDITSVQYSYRYQGSARGRDNFIRYTSSWGLFSSTADTTFDLFYPPSLAFLRALRTNGIELEPNIEEPGHLQWVKKNESSRFFLNVEFQIAPCPEGTTWEVVSQSCVAQVPVLIIPGILASFSSCLFDPNCEEYRFTTCGAFDLGLINVNLTEEWVLDPILDTYDSLIQTFVEAGYELGGTLFTVPYDWRQDNRKTASETLARAIETAKQASGQLAVDVVAHSMGGLVTRYYIEVLNKTDIRKFVMLGTPNHGASHAYFPWEGGDFSVYPITEQVCFWEPTIEKMKIGYGYENRSNREFIQEQIPSLRQLLATYDYILDVNGETTSVDVEGMQWQNDLLPELNYNTLIKNIPIKNIKIFAGNGQRTPSKLLVCGDAPGEDWLDGPPCEQYPKTGQNIDPVNVSYGGDGTVLISSVSLGGISLVEGNGAHTALPDLYKNEVLAFITEK